MKPDPCPIGGTRGVGRGLPRGKGASGPKNSRHHRSGTPNCPGSSGSDPRSATFCSTSTNTTDGFTVSAIHVKPCSISCRVARPAGGGPAADAALAGVPGGLPIQVAARKTVASKRSKKTLQASLPQRFRGALSALVIPLLLRGRQSGPQFMLLGDASGRSCPPH